MNSNSKVLVLALVDPSGNPRPRRIIEFLRGFCSVSVASFSMEHNLKVDGYYKISRPSKGLLQKAARKIVGLMGLLSGNESVQYWLEDMRWGLKSLGRTLSQNKFDWIIVEDIYLLPFAFRIKGTAKILMDAREFYPEEIGGGWLWDITEKPMRISICKKYLNKCDAVMTVSKGLAERYKRDFGVNCFLLRSTPMFHSLRPSAVSQSEIKMVHHGLANRDRRLGSMIDIVSKLDDRFSLDFYLTGDSGHIEELREKASGNPRVRFLKPVRLHEIVPMLNQYDIGLCYLEPNTFNLANCLPNKFFEFIQGRLAIVTGPSADMVELLKQYKCGISSAQFTPDSVASMLNNITAEDIRGMKDASDGAAKDLCYENEISELRNVLGIAP